MEVHHMTLDLQQQQQKIHVVVIHSHVIVHIPDKHIHHVVQIIHVQVEQN